MGRVWHCQGETPWRLRGLGGLRTIAHPELYWAFPCLTQLLGRPFDPKQPCQPLLPFIKRWVSRINGDISMYAVIVTGGKQYKVAQGEFLKVEKLEVAAGESITFDRVRSEEHTSELQSRENLVCRLLLEKKNKINNTT